MKCHPAVPMLDAIDAIIREEVIHLPVKDVHSYADEIRSIAKALSVLAASYAEMSVEMYITLKEKGVLSGIPFREPIQQTMEPNRPTKRGETPMFNSEIQNDKLRALHEEFGKDGMSGHVTANTMAIDRLLRQMDKLETEVKALREKHLDSAD